METCKYFKGDRPCKYYWIDRSWDCSVCEHHSPFKERILLIKLDALGDVVRSTALAEGIKKKYPNSELTWLTTNGAKFFVDSNPFVDRVLEYNNENARRLQFEEFDTIINLDKDSKATSMMMSFNSEDKRGYGLSSEGHVVPLNDGAKYHYNICLDNWNGKTKNIKSYQELIFSVAELDYDMERPFFELDFEKYESFKSQHQWEGNIILLNTGCGPVYPHKKWTFDGFDNLIKLLLRDSNNTIVLCGSKSEIKRNKKLYQQNKSDSLIDVTNNYSIEEFSYLINLSDIIVTGDTVGLHIAISLHKKIVSFFGPTPHQEVNLFGLGKKLVREELDCLNCYDQFPCPYDGKCMSLITADEVYKSIVRLL
jgi:heptosyltransferase-2